MTGVPCKDCARSVEFGGEYNTHCNFLKHPMQDCIGNNNHHFKSKEGKSGRITDEYDVRLWVETKAEQIDEGTQAVTDMHMRVVAVQPGKVDPPAFELDIDCNSLVMEDHLGGLIAVYDKEPFEVPAPILPKRVKKVPNRPFPVICHVCGHDKFIKFRDPGEHMKCRSCGAVTTRATRVYRRHRNRKNFDAAGTMWDFIEMASEATVRIRKKTKEIEERRKRWRK